MSLDSLWIATVVLVLLLVRFALRILRGYGRGVVFTLGRFSGVRGLGIVFLVPWVQQMARVSLRTVVLEAPSQDVITRDNVLVKVSAVVYFRVIDGGRAIIQVEDFFTATSQLAQTALRAALGEHDLDHLLPER